MKKNLLIVLVFFCSLQLLYSQEDGVVSLAIPVRNSLKFNRFVVNPAFSFVREQNSYISFFNKREWVQFENAPQTYLISYSGRFRENQGIAFGLFQQNYGVLSTMGVIGNFAHNVTLDSDANLTFGANVAFYKSGLDDSKVITNYADPSLQNIPSNTLMTINPGINYGTAFFDFGLAANNFFLYSFSTSNFIKDNLEKGIEAHVMYTGYIESYGFFDRSKFTGLLKTELKKEQTILSGQMMISIPKGIWAQAGYNTFYGLSAGLGLNITSKISLEYNYEKTMGDFSNFGASHEIVFAYKFKSNEYGDDDEDEGSIIPPADTRKPVAQAPKVDADAIAKARAEAAAKAKLAAEAKAIAQADAAAKAKLEEEARLKAQADAAANAKLAAEARAKSYADAALKLKLDNEAKAKSKGGAGSKAKSDAALKAKQAADAKAKADAALKAKLAADAKTKSDAAAALKAKQAADAKAKTDADAALKAKQAADAKAKADADAALQAKLAADAKAKADADAALKAKQAADAKAKADADAALQAKLAADAKAKVDADAALKAKQAADAKAKADANAALQAKLAADAKVKADAEAALKAKQAADAKAKADADAALEAKLAADAKAKADADAALQAKLAADAKAKADAEAALKAKQAADAKAKADADAA
ncbi:PorP/SprF family type IX secretion system membrane protein, partial [Flavobacterium maritimum]|uniref:PorP/SprF family type IX secretion system membrane protein n=1 Tax=Flavobacterium maritimum TaxID=3149042 RepID=UPI0032B4333E